MRVSIRNGFQQSNSSSSPCLQVVIDVFRASTTTLALLKVEVEQLVIANDLEIIKNFHARGFEIISEVFDLGIDNSPTLVLNGNYQGKKTLLKTSNLTTAISNNFKESVMVICGFNNVNALSQYILEKNLSWVEIIPAGLMKIEQENPEDSECANLLKSLLEKKQYNVNWEIINDKISRKTKEETRPQFYIDDLDHALKLNFTSIIPNVHKIDNDSFSVTKI